MQFLKIYLLLLFLNVNLGVAMDMPIPDERGQVISALKDIQIRLNAKNIKGKGNLNIDAISPFDITPISITRRNLGELSQNNRLSIGEEKLEFDTGDGKKTIVSALHIYPEGKKTEGLALKLSYNRATHHFDFHLDQLKNNSLTRIATQNLSLKQPTKTHIPLVDLNLVIDSENWPASKLQISQDQIPNPILPSNPGKGPNKSWQFWKK